MQLILIAEHPTKGPQIILSFPRNLSDTICSHLFRLFHVHEKEVTITDLVNETPAIHRARSLFPRLQIQMDKKLC